MNDPKNPIDGDVFKIADNNVCVFVRSVRQHEYGFEVKGFSIAFEDHPSIAMPINQIHTWTTHSPSWMKLDLIVISDDEKALVEKLAKVMLL